MLTVNKTVLVNTVKRCGTASDIPDRDLMILEDEAGDVS